jgi:asparagine synthase (glutamine-hydrolysing)
LLPDAIIDRRKRGFGAPVGAWFKRELAPLRRSLLSRDTLTARGLLDPAAVEALCADHDASREDYTDLIMVLLNLEIWSRLYLDGRGHEDVAAELAEQTRAA